jgi:aldose 1-epimerase
VGGGLRTYSAWGHDLVDGYEVDQMRTSGRGQLLIPWPNRLEDGRYEFDGQTHQLPLNEPESRNAIHGLVRWVPWLIAEREPDRVVLEHWLHPRRGYPFSLGLGIEYLLSEQGLRVRTTATNVGTTSCPYGSGAHPYLTIGTQTVDSLILHSPAGSVLTTDARGLPTGTLGVEGTEYDFRRGRRLGTTALDLAFTNFERGRDGLARFKLSNEGRGASVTLWMDRSFPYAMLFTGDRLPDVNRRSLAVEPMTCPPNAFRSGEGVIRLEPGQSFISMWGITPWA